MTGKTTLGHELADKTDAVFLDVDEARQQLAPGKDWLGPDKEREIMLKELSSDEGAPLGVFLLEIPDQTVIERIEDRKATGSDSNIESLESYSEVKGRYQPPDQATVLLA